MNHRDRVARLGCIVCGAPAEIHHVRKYGEKRDDAKVIPLCPSHHRHGPDAVHNGRRSWEERYGNQVELVAEVYRQLGEEPPEHVREWIERWTDDDNLDIN